MSLLTSKDVSLPENWKWCPIRWGLQHSCFQVCKTRCPPAFPAISCNIDVCICNNCLCVPCDGSCCYMTCSTVMENLTQSSFEKVALPQVIARTVESFEKIRTWCHWVVTVLRILSSLSITCNRDRGSSVHLFSSTYKAGQRYNGQKYS